jgi:hypothetical protein
MCSIECAKVFPQHGAQQVRVYRFDETTEREAPAVWLSLSAQGPIASTAVSADQARDLAAGLLDAAAAIDAQAARG